MSDTINSRRFLRRAVPSYFQRLCRRSAGPVAAATIALTATTATAYATEAQYDCNRGTGLIARFSPPSTAAGDVVLTFDKSGEQVRLPQVMSADGGRYANGKVEFWIRGKGATLTRNGGSETCTSK
jgi:membrane-bound inhibitor of C-type lysozyme